MLNLLKSRLQLVLETFLTGPGSYGTFTYRIKKTETNKCSRCDKEDDPDHVFYVCPRWAEERRALKEMVTTIPETTDIIAYIIEDESKLKTIFDYVVQIMRRKPEERRWREKEDNKH
ncbi:hypothetical protein HHI36_010134 [Cryptolaemus montrouzieri]|uniref:Reverse transcriptase n=1 Tax=Cryptolaemus montrouzieri TaxID=559131 RepID=A0ABD2MIM0_9CUCU